MKKAIAAILFMGCGAAMLTIFKPAEQFASVRVAPEAPVTITADSFDQVLRQLDYEFVRVE